jgi:hypothetical protein
MIAAVRSATVFGVEGRPSPSKSMLPPGCPRSRSSACPTKPAASRAIACVPRSCPAGSPGRRAVSRSTSHRPTSARAAPGSTSRSRSGSSRPTVSCRGHSWRASGSSASSVSTARMRRSPVWPRWWWPWATCARSCRWAASARRRGSSATACASRPPFAKWSTRSTPRRPGRGHRTPNSTTTSQPPPDLADVRGQPMARLGLEVAAAGWPPHAAGGAAGLGQDDARAAHPGPAAGAGAGRRARGDDGAFGRRRSPAGRWSRTTSAVPCAAPQQLHGVAGRRRQHQPAAGRDLPGPRRRAVPRRAGRVRPLRARRPAPAAGGRRHPAGPCSCVRRPAGEVPLVAATNPCPCGGGGPGVLRVRRGGPGCAICGACRARSSTVSTSASASAARRRRPVASGGGEPTASSRSGWTAARDAALDRIGMANAQIPPSQLDELAPLHPAHELTLRDQLERDRLTGRGYHRVRRVARTIADLRGAVTTGGEART